MPGLASKFLEENRGLIEDPIEYKIPSPAIKQKY